jgi:IS30 family transposase
MTKDTATASISYRHLTIEEREEIAIGLASGSSKRAIARSLNRNQSTISRECARNKPPLNKVRYRANCAHQRSCDYKKKSHARERLKSEETRLYVAEKLSLGWTPEIIAGRIKQEGNLPTTNYESIYQWIYSGRRDLIALLPRAHRKRRKRGSAKYKHTSKIPNRVPIENRPLPADMREEIGHWEADTAVSGQSNAAIAVIIERVSRLVKIRLIPSKSAQHMSQALIDCLLPLPTQFRKSITYDNGSENTSHQDINSTLGTHSFFCTPYHSWEKGSVEQVIGLIRRTYPKKTDWALLSASDIATIEFQLNHRPRKCLDFKSPSEVFDALAA